MKKSVPTITEENEKFADAYWKFADMIVDYVNLTFDFRGMLFPDAGEFRYLEINSSGDKYVFEFLHKGENNSDINGFMSLRLTEQGFVADHTSHSIFRVEHLPQTDVRREVERYTLHLNSATGGLIQFSKDSLLEYVEDDGTIKNEIGGALQKVIDATITQMTNEATAILNSAGIPPEIQDEYFSDAIDLKNKIIDVFNNNGDIRNLPKIEGYQVKIVGDDQASLEVKDESFAIRFAVSIGCGGKLLESFSPYISITEHKEGENTGDMTMLYRLYGRNRIESIKIEEVGLDINVKPDAGVIRGHFERMKAIVNDIVNKTTSALSPR